MAKREMKTVKTEEVIVESVVSEIEEKAEDTTPVTAVGVVTDCVKLNVRKKADLKANVIAVLGEKTEVTVYPNESTKDWYKVIVGSVDGYCMKKYITVKQ